MEGAELEFRFPWWVWLAYSFMMTAIAAVGATSYWMEASRSGATVPLWPLVVDEATSVITVFALTPPLIAWTARLHPQRIAWFRIAAGHLAGMLAFALLHVAGMTALRLLVFSLFEKPLSMGSDPLVDTLIYEGRKDA